MNPHAWPTNDLKDDKSLCIARIFHDSSMIFYVFLLCSVDTHQNAPVHCRLIMDCPASHLNKAFPCLSAHHPSSIWKTQRNMCATPKVTSFTILHEAVGGVCKHQITHSTTIFITRCGSAVGMSSNICQLTLCFPTRPAQSVALAGVCS